MGLGEKTCPFSWPVHSHSTFPLTIGTKKETISVREVSTRSIIGGGKGR